MTQNDPVNLYSDDEAWFLGTTTGEVRVFGRFICTSLGETLFFQTTDNKVYFLTGIVTAQRESDRKPGLNPRGWNV